MGNFKVELLCLSNHVKVVYDVHIKSKCSIHGDFHGCNLGVEWVHNDKLSLSFDVNASLSSNIQLWSWILSNELNLDSVKVVSEHFLKLGEEAPHKNWRYINLDL